MAVMRFKLLAAAVIVAAGLGLGGGGWSNPAIAQPPSGTPTPKEIELQRRLDALEAATREAEFRAVRDRALQAVAADAAPAAKYEYEPVPKAGFTPKQLEGRIAERERAGWTLVGQISMTAPYINTKSDGTPLDLPTPSLVFRKVSEAAVKTNPAAEKYRLFDDTQAPKQQAEAAAKLAHSLYMKAVDEKRYAEDKAKAAATVADGNLGELFGPNHPRMKAEASRDGDQLRIAELEREVMRLQVLLKTGGAKLPAAPPPASADTKVPARPMIASDPNAGTGKETASVRMNIKKAEYGTWDPDELIRVIGKVMKEDFQTKQLVGPLHAVAIESGITVVGTPGAVDAFAKWVAVLKK